MSHLSVQQLTTCAIKTVIVSSLNINSRPSVAGPNSQTLIVKI